MFRAVLTLALVFCCVPSTALQMHYRGQKVHHQRFSFSQSGLEKNENVIVVMRDEYVSLEAFNGCPEREWHNFDSNKRLPKRFFAQKSHAGLYWNECNGSPRYKLLAVINPASSCNIADPVCLTIYLEIYVGNQSNVTHSLTLNGSPGHEVYVDGMQRDGETIFDRVTDMFFQWRSLQVQVFWNVDLIGHFSEKVKLLDFVYDHRRRYIDVDKRTVEVKERVTCVQKNLCTKNIQFKWTCFQYDDNEFIGDNNDRFYEASMENIYFKEKGTYKCSCSLHCLILYYDYDYYEGILSRFEQVEESWNGNIHVLSTPIVDEELVVNAVNSSTTNTTTIFNKQTSESSGGRQSRVGLVVGSLVAIFILITLILFVANIFRSGLIRRLRF